MYLNCVLNKDAILAAILDKFQIRNAYAKFGRHILTNKYLLIVYLKEYCHNSDRFRPLGCHLKPFHLTRLIFKQKFNNILKESGSLNNTLVFAPMK